MVRTQIQLTAKQHARLTRVARARHLSLSEVLRRLVDDSLGAEQEGGQSASKLLSTCGAFRETRAQSAAANHDRALAELYR
jgi:hypothetical protein